MCVPQGSGKDKMKFKVGDLVVPVKQDARVNVQIKRIEKVSMSGDLIRFELSDWYEAKEFTLYEESDDDLLELVNKGTQAFKKLYNRKVNIIGKVEESFDWLGTTWNLHSWTKPKLKNLVLGKWKVTITEKEVKIGCETFARISLLESLDELCSSRSSRTDYGPLLAKRNGIEFKDYLMFWVDVETLLKEIR